MDFKEGMLVWHKLFGHCKLAAQVKKDDTLLWGVMKLPGKCTFDKVDSFQLSCLNFKIGQAIQYLGGNYIITALEQDNNRVVVKTSNTTVGSQRYALIPDKCKVEQAQQLRVVVVNERNEIIKEMHQYGIQTTK